MGQRLIDACAVEKVLEEKHFNRVLDSDRWLIADIKKSIMDLPTIDAVPSEPLYDFIREIGAITYGKERFFHEEIGVHCGLWYDRKSCEWITTQTAIEECLKAVRELDDY